MKLERMALDFIEIPLKSPFQTSFGVDSRKTTWIVSVMAEGVTGYSESVADVEPLYSEETHASLYFALKNDLVPRLNQVEIKEPMDVERLLAPVRGNPMAKAAIEMAIWDWYARSQEVPLWALLGGDPERMRIPVGVSIGIQESPSALIDLAERYLAEGYRRLKVKIKPGMDLIPLQQLRQAVGDEVLIMADANSCYGLEDIEVLKALDPLNLMMLEQPLREDDIIDHSVLTHHIHTPICLDEAIRSDHDARKAIEIGACSIINVKVGRVGGHSVARRVHDVAMAHDIPVWCGGMLETGIGRAHNLHLSTLPNFRLPGDTSASNRYFAHDVIDPEFSLNSDGTLSVPDGPGIGVVPDMNRLKAFRTCHEEWILGETLTKGGWPHGSPVSF